MHVSDTNIFYKNSNANETEVSYQRIYSKTNIDAFKNAVKNICWKEVLDEPKDPEKAFDEFLKLFMKTYDARFPLKKKQNKLKIDKNKSPWMTRCILKPVKNKNKLYKSFLKNPNYRNKQKYIKYKNKLNLVPRVPVFNLVYA